MSQPKEVGRTLGPVRDAVPPSTRTLTYTADQASILTVAISARISLCRRRIDELEARGSERTEIATYWRQERELAESLLRQVIGK